MSSLKDLEKRLEEATAGDRELGFKLSITLQGCPQYNGSANSWFGNRPDPTSSLDAAVSLAERVLPSSRDYGRPWLQILHDVAIEMLTNPALSSDQAARLYCLAIVRALIAKGGASD